MDDSADHFEDERADGTDEQERPGRAGDEQSERAPDRERSGSTDLDRRAILKYGGAGALTAGLAGCQSPKNPVPGGQLRVDEETGGEVQSAEGDAPLAGETFRLGVLAPMNLPVGVSMWNAAQLARDQLNSSGGIAGAEVEVKLGNTKVSPGKAASEHKRLVMNEKCDMTCGSFLGSGLLQTLPSISNQEKIHVTTGAADPRPGKLASKSATLIEDSAEKEYEKYKYHFRAGPIHLLDLADAMLEFMQRNKEQYGWESAALLTENIGELTPYADRLKANLSDVIDVPLTYRPGGVSDWSPIFSEIEREGCDVAVVGLALSGTTAVNQWAQQQRQFEFGGIHVPAQAYGYWQSTDGRVEHVFTMNAMTPQTENTSKTQKFVQDYRERFDEVPMYTGPITYDAMSIMKQAISTTVEEEGLEKVPDADTIIPYMEEKTYTGGTIMNEFQFTPPDAEYAHEPQWTSMEETGVPVFQQWQYDPEVREDYGTMHSFAPEQNKTADKTVPDWVG